MRAFRWFGFALVACAVEAHAQTGSIRVSVTDPGAAPLAGASVTLASPLHLIAKTTLSTGASGAVEFPVVRSGPGYLLEVRFAGYEPWSSEPFRVSTGEETSLAVRLKIGIVEEVSAVATRPNVDLSAIGSSTLFSDEVLEDMPVHARVYQNVLTLAPGAVDPDGDGNPNVHGARSRDVRVQVGGVANVDPLTGQWLSYVNADSIEELEVITSGAGAEWGRAQGGWGRILQKQGTNDLEGIVGVMYRGSQLDSPGSTVPPGAAVPQYDAFQPWVQLSGPIVKDRLWFRLSHEWIRREDPINAAFDEVAVKTLAQTSHSDQITWQASPRNKLAFHYDSDPRTIENAEVTSSIPVEGGQRWELGGPTYRISWTAAQSPRLLVSSEIGFQDNAVNILPTTTGVPNRCVRNDYYPSLDYAQCFFSNQNASSGSYYRTSRDLRQRFTLRSDLDWFAGTHAGITHHLHGGFIVESEHYERTLSLGPDASFAWVVNLFGRNPGTATYRLPIPTSAPAQADGDTWGFYLEDQLKPAPNLSITAGLRFDHEEVRGLGFSQFDPMTEYQAFRARVAGGLPVATAMVRSFTAFESFAAIETSLAQQLGITPSLARTLLSPTLQQSAGWDQKRASKQIQIDNANWAPRLSIAWDPASDGKTKLMLSAGRYYDKIFLAVPLIEQEPASTFITQDAFRNLRGQWFTYGTPERDLTISQRTVNPDLKTPYQDELALSFERSLTSQTTAKVTLIRRAFKDQLQDEDVNHLPADFGTCRLVSRTWLLDVSAGPDGILDDCMIRPDGIADLYQLNPAWGQVLRVSNLNTALYRAAVLELRRRLYQGWQLEGSYTLSRVEGNAEDFDQVLGNDRTMLDDEQGVLSYDQTHVLKLSATGQLAHGFHVGGIVRWEAGLPYSRYESVITLWGVPPGSLGATSQLASLRFEDEHVRNDQRNEPLWTINFRLAKDWTFGRHVNAQLAVDVFNVLNSDQRTIVDVTDGTEEWIGRTGRRWQLGGKLVF